ncbi:hypothetical protein GSI_09460 [Ganoderma sinense ZZ0214-1]|uniref:Uncharacterized protein n=1 Tax=Ganoderma sinense ZZ0214-1 TaxID=1077348 RepID=A0A2G8S785_9APHY|nr:hypothetical protein GSI_09460 [Ganoderma sinense ZZ0214-1]
MSDNEDVSDLIEIPILPPFPRTPAYPESSSLLESQPYDFNNEPAELRDSDMYSIRPLTPDSGEEKEHGPEVNFLCHWLNHEEWGIGFPPRSLGMEVREGDVCLEIFPNGMSALPVVNVDKLPAGRRCCLLF